jgi:hypothetical protein
MNVDLKRLWNKFLVAGATVALVTGMASTLPSAYAGGTIKADDDQWISVGIGIRMAFRGIENGSANGRAFANNFDIDNTRIYINGQIHKYIKFTFNTECFQCPRNQNANSTSSGGNLLFGNNSAIGLLDAIGKFEYNELLNVWVGRTLIPNERGELNGPFYHQTYEGFKTPFASSDLSANFGSGNGAGLYGRDNGVVYFGKAHPGGTHLLWVGSVFQGLNSRGVGGPNTQNSLLYSGRLQWNLLNDEMSGNPGYYTAGGYYGTVGDLLALAVGTTHQKDGAGSLQHRADATTLEFDLLFEKLLPNNMGVFTFNGEFKRFWAQSINAWADANCFCQFAGHSWTAYGLYLLPNKIGWGQFQPYFRFTDISPTQSQKRQEWEFGTNYVIKGFNARVSAFWQYGDLAAKGMFNFSPVVAGDRAHAYKVALQLQY